MSDREIPLPIPCHANELFKDAKKSDCTKLTDADRITFLKGLVAIINGMRLQIRYLGYRRNDGMESLSSQLSSNYNRFEKYPNFEKEFVLGTLFFTGFIPSKDSTDNDSPVELHNGSSNAVVYYCIENDNSLEQQHTFHRNSADSMWRQAFIEKYMSVDLDQVGDVLSFTKGDPLGVLPDCMAYILHLRWLEQQGY